MKRKIIALALALVILCTFVSCGGSKVKIVKSAASTVKYEKYDNGLISLEIPKGWEVTIAPADYIHYSFKVTDPDDPGYMLLFGLKQEGFLKSEKARKTYAKYYPDAVFSKLTAVSPNDARGFYAAWNANSKYINETQMGYEYFPYLNDYNIIEGLGNTPLGGEILRASFTDGSERRMEGLFTASVYDAGSYYINVDIWNVYSEKVDVWPLNVYNIVAMTAPEEEFASWQPILDHCLSTLEFSSTFVSNFNAEESALVSTIQANQRVYDSISDMIMDSWEQRNASYDIISQKQSDATLGYERVYDTETGEVYKAYNGFTDDYSGKRYQPITDDMYTAPISGYIEK